MLLIIVLHSSRVIWLGDLNYRLALPDKEIWKLANRGDWEALLAKDQVLVVDFLNVKSSLMINCS